jgi:ABC-type sulfate transport system substrate-binding protein
MHDLFLQNIIQLFAKVLMQVNVYLKHNRGFQEAFECEMTAEEVEIYAKYKKNLTISKITNQSKSAMDSTEADTITIYQESDIAAVVGHRHLS